MHEVRQKPDKAGQEPFAILFGFDDKFNPVYFALMKDRIVTWRYRGREFRTAQLKTYMVEIFAFIIALLILIYIYLYFGLLSAGITGGLLTYFLLYQTPSDIASFFKKGTVKSIVRRMINNGVSLVVTDPNLIQQIYTSFNVSAGKRTVISSNELINIILSATGSEPLVEFHAIGKKKTHRILHEEYTYKFLYIPLDTIIELLSNTSFAPLLKAQGKQKLNVSQPTPVPNQPQPVPQLPKATVATTPPKPPAFSIQHDSMRYLSRGILAFSIASILIVLTDIVGSYGLVILGLLSFIVIIIAANWLKKGLEPLEGTIPWAKWGIWGSIAALVIAAIAIIVAIIAGAAYAAYMQASYNGDLISAANYYNESSTALTVEPFLGLIMAIGFSLAFVAVSNVGSYYNSNVIKYSALALIVLYLGRYLLPRFMNFVSSVSTVDLIIAKANIADILSVLVFAVGLVCAWGIYRISNATTAPFIAQAQFPLQAAQPLQVKSTEEPEKRKTTVEEQPSQATQPKETGIGGVVEGQRAKMESTAISSRSYPEEENINAMPSAPPPPPPQPINQYSLIEEQRVSPIREVPQPQPSVAFLALPNGWAFRVSLGHVFGRSDFANFFPGEITQYISARHFRVYYKNGRWYIEDLGSVNGTLVNGVEIRGMGPVPLEDNDVISPAGVITLVFKTSVTSIDKERYY